MFGRNSSPKTPYYYRKLLSPFGQTVLDVLIKQEKSEQEHNNITYKRQYNHTERTERNERVLTFRDETSNQPPDEHLFDYQQEILNIPSSCNTILATGELLNTPQINDNYFEGNERNYNSSREDLIRPAEVITLTIDDTFNGNSSKVKENLVKSKSRCNEKDVSWNNMFDSELFGDIICDNDIDDEKNRNNYETKKTDNKPNEVRTFSINEPNIKTLHSKINIISNETVNLEELSKTMKRKLQTQKTEPVTKKTKIKTNIKKSEPSLRKQKYTKAVKNWLNDVDPKNPIEEDVIQEVDNNMNITESNEPNQTAKEKSGGEIANYVKVDKPQKKLNIEIGPKNKMKKTVQCKLANRDGVMKFKKPKETDINSTPPAECNNGHSDYINAQTEHINGKNNCHIEKANDDNGKSDNFKSDHDEGKSNSGKLDLNNFKDEDNTPKILSHGPAKKVKPKFIPPIKSQLPIKDILYKVIELGKDNSFEGDALFAMEKQNISIILMFANGFNQLNIQYTEEETRASGILLKTDNTHYFIRTRDVDRSTLMIYREKISALMTNNLVQCFDGKHVLIHLINKLELNIPPQMLDLFDLKIAGALLFPENIPESFSALQKSLGESASYTVCTECPLQKGAWYLQQFEPCVVTARSMLQQLHMKTVFYDIEMKLVPIVAGMESRGLRVEVNELSRAESALVRELAVAETSCKELGGADFSPASLIHLRRVLYDKLQLHTHTNVPHTALTRQRSTNEETLRALSGVHELPGRVLRYRHVARARALLTALRQRIQHTNRLSPNWIQIASSTGRMAATNPNLQAIPKTPFIVTGENGKEESVNLRGIFVSDVGHTLVSLDFDHVECRLAARLAEDRPLLEALQHQDLFSHLAAHWLNKPASEVNAEERERAKRMVYASMYGAGTRKLMDILNLSYPQTRDLIATFNQRFPRLREFCSEVRSQCEGGGGRVHTSTGRARNILPALANTQAVNFIVQGTAADVCKRAMISAVAADTSASLLLQIHDELLWEVPNDHLHQTIAVIRECMEQSGFGDRLPVSVSTGPNWGEMTPYMASIN